MAMRPVLASVTLVALLLTALFAGCAKEEPPPPTPEPPRAAPQPPPPPPPPPPAVDTLRQQRCSGDPRQESRLFE